MTKIDFSEYLRAFDYDERVDMKIQLPEMLKLYKEKKYKLSTSAFMKNMPPGM